MIGLWPAAAAADSYEITPPPGWQSYPPLEESQSEMVRTSDPLGGLRFGVKVKAYAKPQQGAFYVTWIEADEASDELGAKIRRVFDDTRNARIATSPQAGSTEELFHSESKADNIASLNLSWRHISNETVSISRTLAWATADNKLRLVRAECVLSAGSGEEAACKKALESLAAKTDQRAELADIPASHAIDDNRRPDALQVGDLGKGNAGEEAGDGGVSAETGDTGDGKDGPELKAPTTDAVVYKDPNADEEKDSGTNKILIVAGGILLVVAFWFTTRRREEDPLPEPERDEDAADDEDAASDEEE